MHEFFSDWLRNTDLGANDETVRARSTGLASFVSALDSAATMDTVRLAFAPDRAGQAIQQQLRTHIQQADSSFPMHGATADLAMLAASAIAELCSGEPSERADIAALASFTRSLSGKLAPSRAHELFDMVGGYLRKRAVNVRMAAQGGQLMTSNQKGQLTKQANEGDQGVLNTALIEQLSQTANATAQTLAHLEARLEKLSEETNIYWWAASDWSDTLEESRSTGATEALCLPLAADLSGLCHFQVPPAASRQLLGQALKQAKRKKASVTIETVVNATSRHWRAKLVSSHSNAGLRELVPVFSAVERSLETDDDGGWQAGYQGAIGLDPKTGFQPSQLSDQLLHEMELLKRVGS